MKRLIFDRYGDPLEVLRIENADLPVPADNELLVRMIRRPINPYELAIIAGNDKEDLAKPQVPGFEGLGVVESSGSKVTAAFRKGQRVIPTPVELPGTWQEYVTGKAGQFIPVPDDVADDPAALILNPLTCLVILKEILNITEGQWLLNTAASTNIGQLLIQFSRIRRFKLINVVRNSAAARHIASLGAEHIINTETDDIRQVAGELTKGTGVDGIIDPVGGGLGSEAARTLAFGAKMLLFSDMSGEPVDIDPMEFISKKLTIMGYTSLHWLNENSYERKSAFVHEIFALISNGSLELRSDGESALADFAAAISRSKTSGRSGKIMLV